MLSLKFFTIGATLAGAGVIAALFAPAVAQPLHPSYAIVAEVPAGNADGQFDYAAIDANARLLLLAQRGVTLVNLDTRKVSPGFVRAQQPHGVLPLGGGNAALADASAHAVLFFDTRSGKVVHSTRIGDAANAGFHDPDALVYDPKTHLLIAINGGTGDLVLLDPKRFTVQHRIHLTPGLEFAAVDGTGKLFVNEEERNAVAVVNLVSRKVVAEFPLKGCDGPTGMAYDRADRLVISVCANGVAKFIAATGGQEVASIKVGGGADAIMFDSARHVAFSPSGLDGTLTVIAVRGRKDINAVQTIRTQVGCRLGALDPVTGNVYLPAAKFGPPAPPLKLPGMEIPGMNSGTFKFLVVGPVTGR